jgi:hypothetical protein
MVVVSVVDSVVLRLLSSLVSRSSLGFVAIMMVACFSRTACAASRTSTTSRGYRAMTVAFGTPSCRYSPKGSAQTNSIQQYRLVPSLHSCGSHNRWVMGRTVGGRLYSSEGKNNGSSGNAAAGDFKNGDKIQVEVAFFGTLGASVDVVGHGSHEEQDCIGVDEPSMGRGLILQREIQYFRAARDGVDVVVGEILPGYIEKIHFVQGGETRIDVSLRPVGGRAKASMVSDQILELLEDAQSGGSLPIGDKSTPNEISNFFPGVSKSSFKQAVSQLYKLGKVQPGPKSIMLLTSSGGPTKKN